MLGVIGSIRLRSGDFLAFLGHRRRWLLIQLFKLLQPFPIGESMFYVLLLLFVTFLVVHFFAVVAEVLLLASLLLPVPDSLAAIWRSLDCRGIF